MSNLNCQRGPSGGLPASRLQWDAAAAVILASLVLIPAASAGTLHQAFVQAYASNASIRAGEAELRAAGFGVQSAQAGYKPQINFEAGVGTAHNDLASPFFPISTYPQNTRTAGLVITQPLYTGGQTSSQVNAARAVQSAQQAKLSATEEEVFMQVVQSYSDVVRDQAVVKLDQNNLVVLNQQLQAAQAEFQNGEVTHTDVAQAEARVAGAQAALIQAQGSLTESRAAYLRVVGAEPQGLEQPSLPVPLPESEAQAVQFSAENFSVLAARFAQNAAEQQVQVAAGQQRPQIALTGQLLEARDPQVGFSRLDTRSIMLTLSVPIYSGGALSAQKHAAEQRAEASHDDLVDAQRQAQLEAINAWQAYQTANARLTAIQSQVQAEEIAARGVRDEQAVGERTTIDVLNADQELLNARVDQIRAQRDQLVAAYALQAATGKLTADALNLPNVSDGQPRG
ncbi:MAG: TolC family outer membrane protein [Gammaproteobacteria bacterium]|nr:TolC family outer membrane protein [Gammaproteobacteria bacterium]